MQKCFYCPAHNYIFLQIFDLLFASILCRSEILDKKIKFGKGIVTPQARREHTSLRSEEMLGLTRQSNHYTFYWKLCSLYWMILLAFLLFLSLSYFPNFHIILQYRRIMQDGIFHLMKIRGYTLCLKAIDRYDIYAVLSSICRSRSCEYHHERGLILFGNV